MPEYRVILTDLADTDLGDIFSYVADTLREPDIAAKLVERLYTALNKLSQNPLRCPSAKDRYLAKQGFRTLFVESHIIFFVVDTEGNDVIIHRVIYGKRQYRSLFE